MNISASGLATKVGIPVALAAAAVWAVNSYVSPDAAKKLLAIILIFAAALLIVWLPGVADPGPGGVDVRGTVARQGRARSGPGRKGRPRRSGLPWTRCRGISTSRCGSCASPKWPGAARGTRRCTPSPGWSCSARRSRARRTLLRDSGVEFPYSTAGEARKSKRAGVGAGCEFWFSRDAVVLDMSGPASGPRTRNSRCSRASSTA